MSGLGLCGEPFVQVLIETIGDKMESFEIDELTFVKQREIIRQWFVYGKQEQDASHMFVVYDRNNERVYPIYVSRMEDLFKKYWDVNDHFFMIDVDEVYSYRRDFESQIFGKRAWNFS